MEQITDVRIQGISALLMHAFPMQPIEALEKKTPAEQAEYAAYRDPDTAELYVPGVAMQRALISGATYSKGKGRGSLTKMAAACLMVNPERIALAGVDGYKVDARPVVVPATKGRIMRYRPRFDSWELSFELAWDDGLMSEKQVRQIIDDTGSKVGLLDFRPEKRGPFGRFIVTHWETRRGMARLG